MTREQLEHIIRAAATITGCEEIVVVGSQAILGEHPDAPAEMRVSNEADVYPRARPELAILIDGAIGELSAFHDTFRYYAEGVGPETATLPAGWEERLVRIRADVGVGLCLETHDLVLSKYAAGREKDRDYVRAAARHGLVRQDVLLERLLTLPVPEEHRARLRGLIGQDFATHLGMDQFRRGSEPSRER